jgi:hypothetical protein
VTLQTDEAVPSPSGEDEGQEQLAPLDGALSAPKASVGDTEYLDSRADLLRGVARQASAARQFVPIRVFDVAHPSKLSWRQYRSNPPDAGIVKVGRRYQRRCLTGRVQRDPNPSTESLAGQFPQQEHGDHFVIAALADHTHADQ